MKSLILTTFSNGKSMLPGLVFYLVVTVLRGVDECRQGDEVVQVTDGELPGERERSAAVSQQAAAGALDG